MPGGSFSRYSQKVFCLGLVLWAQLYLGCALVTPTSVSGDKTVTTIDASVHILSTGLDQKAYTSLAKELGVTEAALRGFFSILKEHAVPTDQLDNKLRQIAQSYNDLQARWQQFKSGDERVLSLRAKAKLSMEKNELKTAEEYLDKAAQLDLESAEMMTKLVRERKSTAASSLADSGLIKMMGLKFGEAAQLFKKAADQLDGISPFIQAKYLNYYGRACYEMADSEAAYKAFKSALELLGPVSGGRTSEEAALLNNLAVVANDLGKPALAVEALEKVIELKRKLPGDNERMISTSLQNLANVYAKTGAFEKAEILYSEALEIDIRVLGREHLETAKTMNGLGGLFLTMGRFDNARYLLEESAAIKKLHAEGANGLSLAYTLQNLAKLALKTNRPKEGEEYFSQALKIRQNILGDSHPATVSILSEYGDLCMQLGEWKQAEVYHRRVLTVSLAEPTTTRIRLLEILSKVLKASEKQGKYGETVQLYQELLGLRIMEFGYDSSDVLSTLCNLVELHAKHQRGDRAEATYKHVLEIGVIVVGEYLSGEYGNSVVEQEEDKNKSVDQMEDPGTLFLHPPIAMAGLAMAEVYLAEKNYVKTLVILKSLSDRSPLFTDSSHAQEFLSRLLAVSESTIALTGKSLVAVSLYENIGAAGLEQKQWKLAAEAYDASAKIFIELKGERHRDLSTFLGGIARAFENMNQAEEAEEMYAKALGYTQSEFTVEEMMKLIVPATQFYLKGPSSLKALELYHEIVDSHEFPYGLNDMDAVAVLVNLLDSSRAKGSQWQSDRYVLELIKSVTNRGASVLSALYRDDQNMSSVAGKLIDALTAGQLKDDKNLGKVFSQFGKLLFEYGPEARREAEDVLSFTLEAQENLLGVAHRDTFETVMTLGRLYLSDGRYDEASKLFSKIFELGLSSLGSPSEDLSGHVSEIAGLFRDNSQIDRAIVFQELAAKLTVQAHGSESLEMLPLLVGLGDLYQAAGKHGEALKVFQGLAESRLVVEGGTILTLETLQYKMGQLLILANRLDEAKYHLEQALEENQRQGLESSSRRPRYWVELAHVSNALGDKPGAENSMLKVAEILERSEDSDEKLQLEGLLSGGKFLVSKRVEVAHALYIIANKLAETTVFPLTGGLLTLYEKGISTLEELGVQVGEEWIQALLRLGESDSSRVVIVDRIMFHERLARLLEDQNSPEDLLLQVQFKLAKSYENLGSGSEAEAVYRSQLEKYSEPSGIQQFWLVAVLREYAAFLDRAGRDHEAMDLESQARLINQGGQLRELEYSGESFRH